MLIIFGGSLFYLFLYPTPYYADVLSSQKIAIVDYDMSSSSQEFIHFVRASPHLEIVEILDNYEKVQGLIESNQIYGVIVIPHGFQKHLYQRIPPVVAIVANASYMLIYGAIANASAECIEAFNTHMKTKLQTNEAEILSPTFMPLFNPTMGYINYTLAPILIFILHQTLVAGAGIIGGTQNQQFTQGVRNYYAWANPFKIVLSKILILFCIYAVLFAFYFGFAYEFYNVHVSANILDFWLFSIAFILCSAAFGVFFGTLLPKRALATQIIMIASMPIVFLLGFMWPKAQIAAWANYIISFLPAYHGINGLLEMNQMGAKFADVSGYFISLCVLCVIYVCSSVFMIYKKTLRW